MLLIALTGGIGSGKTTVSELFKSKSIPIIDTDIIAREIVEQGKPAYIEIIKTFGEDIVDKNNNINRLILRELIFSSEEKRLQLENILHPLIWSEVKAQLSLLAEKNYPYCIVVVPLLLENISRNKPVEFDRILIVDAEEDIQIKRTVKRDNSSVLQIKEIMKTQVSRQVRIDAADDIILNTDNLDSLYNQVNQLHKKYLELTS